MRWCSAVVLVFACSVVGCAASDSKQGSPAGAAPGLVSDATTACIDGHPAGEPFDVGEADPSGGAQPALETFQAQCRSAGGSGCEGAFISKEAARCIAQNEKLETGLEPWSIGMWYEDSYRRLGWEIQNLIEDQGPTYKGTTLTVDAVSGRVLGRSNWSTTQ
jgi:hypothetical protein